jgi:hypothetical protein
MILGYPFNSNAEAWMDSHFFILLIYGLFNYTVNITEDIVSDGKIVNK